MSEFVISTRYANALMEISEEKNSFERTLEDMELVNQTLLNSKDLKNVLQNPIISSDKKSTILEEVFASHISEGVKNFLKLIVNKGRENILLEISNRFLELCDEKLNRTKVQISSAIELSDEQKENIAKKLEEITNKKIISEYNIDNSIIGGFKARFGDTIIDASVKHQLELLKKKLFEQNYLSN
ncbi:MAG: ATP synthase F1 subunit delta [Melioribacteraceae bacterium]